MEGFYCSGRNEVRMHVRVMIHKLCNFSDSNYELKISGKIHTNTFIFLSLEH